MDLGGNLVLVTGGATGIGWALSERFLRAGSEVIICGRREDRLHARRLQHAGLHVRVCDVARPEERIALVEWVEKEFPSLNVVVNNAGIQRRVALAAPEIWEATHEEIAINLEAPIHLSRLFVPHLLRQPRPTLVTVTSGLAFVPKTDVPVYSATKAGLHSYVLSLRHQLAATPIRVVEVIPPAVDTDLQAPGLHTFGVNVDVLADDVMHRLAAGELEIAHGTAVVSSQAGRDTLAGIFARIND